MNISNVSVSEDTENQVNKLQRKFCVTVVIVTYGDRAHLLAEVIQGIEEQTVGDTIKNIIVYNNGANEKTVSLLREVYLNDKRLYVIEGRNNKGSAVGYAMAINEAVKRNAEYIWCLDDDNRPNPDALEQLLIAIESINEKGPMALLSLRNDREQYIKRAFGASIDEAFGRPYSALGFSVNDIPRKIFDRLSNKVTEADINYKIFMEPQLIPYGPYGGFFFKAEVISIVGLPREDFYLYGDDHEFTARFTANDIPIYLVPKSRVNDVERSWHIDRTRSSRWGSNRLLRHGEEEKIYRLFYTIRNRTFFETHCLNWRKKPQYYVNLVAYLILLFFQAIFLCLKGDYLPWRSYKVILMAVKEGFRGHLGKVNDFLE